MNKGPFLGKLNKFEYRNHMLSCSPDFMDSDFFFFLAFVASSDVPPLFLDLLKAHVELCEMQLLDLFQCIDFHYSVLVLRVRYLKK